MSWPLSWHLSYSCPCPGIRSPSPRCRTCLLSRPCTGMWLRCLFARMPPRCLISCPASLPSWIPDASTGWVLSVAGDEYLPVLRDLQTMSYARHVLQFASLRLRHVANSWPSVARGESYTTFNNSRSLGFVKVAGVIISICWAERGI
jgi:hypothetical protein